MEAWYVEVDVSLEYQQGILEHELRIQRSKDNSASSDVGVLATEV